MSMLGKTSHCTKQFPLPSPPFQIKSGPVMGEQYDGTSGNEGTGVGRREREAFRSGAGSVRWGNPRWVPHPGGAPGVACWPPAWTCETPAHRWRRTPGRSRPSATRPPCWPRAPRSPATGADNLRGDNTHTLWEDNPHKHSCSVSSSELFNYLFIGGL